MRMFVMCFLAAALLAGCDPVQRGATGFSPGGVSLDSVPDGEKAQATFTGGDGSRLNEAVVILNTRNERTGVRAEYVWLHEHFPGHQLLGQSLRHENNKAYDVMAIKTATGERRTVFFDITSFFGVF